MLLQNNLQNYKVDVFGIPRDITSIMLDEVVMVKLIKCKCFNQF